jgi:hypothetical protein
MSSFHKALSDHTKRQNNIRDNHVFRAKVGEQVFIGMGRLSTVLGLAETVSSRIGEALLNYILPRGDVAERK